MRAPEHSAACLLPGATHSRTHPATALSAKVGGTSTWLASQHHQQDRQMMVDAIQQCPRVTDKSNLLPQQVSARLSPPPQQSGTSCCRWRPSRRTPNAAVRPRAAARCTQIAGQLLPGQHLHALTSVHCAIGLPVAALHPMHPLFWRSYTVQYSVTLHVSEFLDGCISDNHSAGDLPQPHVKHISYSKSSKYPASQVCAQALERAWCGSQPSLGQRDGNLKHICGAVALQAAVMHARVHRRRPPTRLRSCGSMKTR